MNIEDNITNLIKAGVPIIQIISYETQRIHGIINEASKNLDRDWYIWNRVEGIKKWSENEFEEADEEKRAIQEALEFFIEEETYMILILENIHPDLQDNQPETIQRLLNIALKNASGKTLVLTQPFSFIPKELEKDIQVLELPLPNLEDLRIIFRSVCEQFNLKESEFEESEILLESSLGLTIMEARIAFGKAIVESEQLTDAEIPIIISEKENVIKKSGYLEYYHPKESLNDIGGLDQLKDWLERRGKAFGPGAKDYGLDTPRGILLLGLPGTGKSLSAKAVSSAWQFPLLRLDMGKIFGGIVGQSEQNIRGALKVAEAIAPSILWIDEIEKGLSGSQNSGQTDGGTTSRVLGTFLTWLQEKTKPVFVVATANDISQMPPELLRKGRMDEIFFVDLPTADEREEILKIHLSRKGRNPEDYDLSSLSEISRGYTGAELEETIKEALFNGFERGEQINTQDLKNAIEATYPLSRTMGEIITHLRQWAKGRAVMASSSPPEEPPQKDADNDKNTPRLRQEMANPFIKSDS